MSFYLTDERIGVASKRGGGVDIPWNVEEANKTYRIAHGLGRVPRACFCSMSDGRQVDIRVIERDRETISIQFDASPANIIIRCE